MLKYDILYLLSGWFYVTLLQYTVCFSVLSLHADLKVIKPASIYFFWPPGGGGTSSEHNIDVLSPYKANMVNMLANKTFIHTADRKHLHPPGVLFLAF